MADVGFYYGWETKIYWSIEGTYGTASTTASQYYQPAYIRSFSWNLNENVERIYGPGGSYRRGPTTEVKGLKEVTASMEFWMADDLSSTTAVEQFMIKLPLDKFNTAVSGTNPGTWAIPETAGTYPGDSAYGSYSLLPFSLEFGWNKNGTNSTRVRTLTGMYVNSQTFKAARGEKCTWTWDMVGKDVDTSNGFLGTGTQSTNKPLDWSGVQITWTGEDESATAHTGCTAVEFTINNNMEMVNDLSSTGQDREVSAYITGKRDVSGSMTWYKKITAGQKWAEIVFSATAAQTTPDNTIELGHLDVKIASATATSYITYEIYDLVLGELPEEVDFEKATEITLPFTARYVAADIVTMNHDAGPTDWDTQAS